MSSVAIAQAILDKTLAVTIKERRPELYRAFNEAGIRLSADNTSVISVDVADQLAFAKLIKNLSPLPVAKIGAKQVLAQHRVHV